MRRKRARSAASAAVASERDPRLAPGVDKQKHQQRVSARRRKQMTRATRSASTATIVAPQDRGRKLQARGSITSGSSGMTTAHKTVPRSGDSPLAASVSTATLSPVAIARR